MGKKPFRLGWKFSSAHEPNYFRKAKEKLTIDLSYPKRSIYFSEEERKSELIIP